MLLKRILSAVFGILFLFTIIIWGSFPFFLLVLIAALVAINEYNDMLKILDKKNQIFLSFFAILILITTYLNNIRIIDISWGLFLILIFFFVVVYHIIKVDSDRFLDVFAYNLIALIYIAGGLSFFIFLRDFSIIPFDSTKAIWLVLLVTWATDIGAFFVGNKFGKRKLSSKSPNKSLEGAFGGIISSVMVVFIYTMTIGSFSLSWLFYAIVISIIAMFGDLFESSLKRFSGVKDTAELIPGHGGLLDRIDSLLFSAAFTYYFLVFYLG